MTLNLEHPAVCWHLPRDEANVYPRADAGVSPICAVGRAKLRHPRTAIGTADPVPPAPWAPFCHINPLASILYNFPCFGLSQGTCVFLLQFSGEAAEEDISIVPVDPGDSIFLHQEHYHLYLGAAPPKLFTFTTQETLGIVARLSG